MDNQTLLPKLNPCACGRSVEFYGPEHWVPTFYDPDSGGVPYEVSCKCGLQWYSGTWEYDEAVEAWNARTNNDKEGLHG